MTEVMAAPGKPVAARPDRLTLAAFTLIVLLGGLNAVAVRAASAQMAPFWGAGALQRRPP